MKRLILILGIAVMSMAATTVYGLEYSSSAGGQLAKANIDPATTSLSVSGPVNAADLYYIGDKLQHLAQLDLSEATIEDYFGDFLHLKDRYTSATLPPMVFSGLPLTDILLPVGQRITIGDGALSGTQITVIDLHNVDSIGYGTFAGCSKLKEITVSTPHIGLDAFKDCAALTTADVTALEVLPAGIFARCAALNQVKGSANITYIGEEAFAGCSSLSSFTFSPELKHIGARAFEFSGLETARLDKCTLLTSIGERSFASCPHLAAVTLSANITELGAGAFFEDSSLGSMTLPGGISVLPARLLKGATSLAGALAIPDGVTEIGDFAMKDLTAVDSVRLPGTLTTLGNYAMENMSGLKKIEATELEAVPAVGIDVWRGVDQPNVKVRVDEDLYEAFTNADQWDKFTYESVMGVDDITADITAPTISGHFEGSDLLVSCGGADISRLSLYDLSGRLLVSVHPSGDYVVIGTAQYDGHVFVVSAILSDGRRATLKLARQ